VEAERTKELKRVAPRLFLGLLAVESFALPIFRSGGRTELSFWSWVVNHTVFGPAVEYVPVERYSREIEGIFPWYPVKESTQTFRTMEEAMAYFKTDQVVVKEMVKNGAISIIAGDSKLQQYDDLLADVRHDQKYHSIRSLVQPNDSEVRDVARVLVQAPDFIAATQEFVNSFTTYRSEVGDLWTTPAETLAARAGDCVTGDTPVWIKVNDQVSLAEVRELLPNGSDYAQFGGIEMFTPSGFAPLVSIRRKGKRETIRVLSSSDIGMTSDHQILVNPYLHEAGRYKKAGIVGLDQLVKLYPPMVHAEGENSEWEYEVGWAYGLFFADGSSSLRHRVQTLGGESWRIVNASSDYLDRASAAFGKLFPAIIFPIRSYDSYGEGSDVNSSRFKGKRVKTLYCLDALLKVDSQKGIRAKFVRNFLNEVYNAFHIKRVPAFILNGSVSMARGFWDGTLAGDGEQNGMRITAHNKLSSFGLSVILRKLGTTGCVRPDHSSVRVWPDGKSPSLRLDSGMQEVFDVATSTGEFVAADVAVKNCDDKAILLASILRNYIPPDKVYCAFGLWRAGKEATGHMWIITEGEDGEDRVVEATAGPEKPSRGKYILHGMFNDTYAFSTDVGLREFDLKPVEMAELTVRR